VNQFGTARTKCEAIAVNVIAPMCNEELCIELNKCISVCIAIDASNRNYIKIVPVIVCYLLLQADVKVKCLTLSLSQEETPEISTNHLLLLPKNMNL
jgi:hypothetical protein